MSTESKETTPTLIIEPRRRNADPYQGVTDNVVAAARDALPALADVLVPAAHAFWERIQHANLRPKEVELELGVSLEGKTNWVVVAGGEASITVTLRW